MIYNKNTFVYLKRDSCRPIKKRLRPLHML